VVGTVDAVDMPARTLKAKDTLGEQKFTLGDNCRIISSGEKAGYFKDLKLGQKYRFTYENLNGVNILNRISPVEEANRAETASAR
jgi:hypothetical protein